MASAFYKKFNPPKPSAGIDLRSVVKCVIEDKISRFGFFTKERKLSYRGAAIPYGASEIIAHGLKNRLIDSAVMVCDGAGTVVVADPETTQGIGARMHSILKTSPIPAVIRKLRGRGCKVVSADGKINQAAGVAEAARSGYKKIAVTVNAYKGETLKKIREVARRHNVSVTILMICTTGIKEERVKEMQRYADLVWACHSDSVRARFDKTAMACLSKIAPVYVLTERGMKLVSGYSANIYGIRKEMRRI
jgi:putative methanogenesis marker protein 8